MTPKPNHNNTHIGTPFNSKWSLYCRSVIGMLVTTAGCKSDSKQITWLIGVLMYCIIYHLAVFLTEGIELLIRICLSCIEISFGISNK